MRRGITAKRLDPQFQDLERRKIAYYSATQFPLIKVVDIATYIQYGISERANTDELGVPMIRMINLQANGWELSDLKHIELEGEVLDRYRLEREDLLFNRTNSKELVGKCEVFEQDGDWVFASYLIRVRIDKQKALPRFVSSFLNCPSGRVQIDQVSRQIAGMSNVNAEELKTLLIPLPPLGIQTLMLEQLDAARAERDRALVESARLLASIDAMVKEKLGLPDFPASKSGGYAIRLATAKSGSSLSADYFHPERMRALNAIQCLPHAPLSQLVSFKRAGFKSPGDERYIGLASVEGDTGQLTDATETATGQCFTFEQGDVLYGRLRPYLNKVWLAEFPGVCSTEFHVMRPLNTQTLKPEYLAVVMRTSLIVAQTKHMMTGNTHPRIANEDVVNLLVPLTDAEMQDLIVNETLSRQAESVRLRNHAETVWREARVHFEQQLLKGNAA